MKFSATIIDKDTSEGVPYATVELWYNNVMLARTAASVSGSFSVDSVSIPDQVRISSASYKQTAYPFDKISDDSYLVIEKNITEGDNVIVTAFKKKPWLWLALGLGLLALSDVKKQR